MKLLGLLLVVCCGAGIGVMQAMRLRQTHRNLEQLCRMLRELSVQMAFRSLTVQELLEQLCRETAREHRCAQRRLQEVEEAMASEQEKSCPEALPAASGPTQLEQLSRKLNAANAELRRYETRMFAYERTMLSLRKENAELTARCEELRSELDKISTAPLRLDVPSIQPAVPFPETAAQTPPAADRQPKTKLEHLGDEVLAELAKLMP